MCAVILLICRFLPSLSVMLSQLVGWVFLTLTGGSLSGRGASMTSARSGRVIPSLSLSPDLSAFKASVEHSPSTSTQ